MGAAARAYRCVSCRTKTDRGFDVCPSCGFLGSCLTVVGPDDDDEESHESDPARPLASFEDAPIERVSVCEPWNTLLGPDEDPGLPMPSEGEGSSILVAGPAGIGKTTEVLRLAASAAAEGEEVVWIPAEVNMGPSALRNIASRAELELPTRLRILPAGSLTELCSGLRARQRGLVIVDSISVFDDQSSTWKAFRMAAPGACLITITHVNKSGGISGPGRLSYFVDTVVRMTQRWISIPQKNRYGPPRKVARPKMVRLITPASRP